MVSIRIKTYWRFLKRLIHRYLERKIQRRMVLNFVGLGVVPILIVSFILIRLTENTVQTYIFERNMEIARKAGSEISLFLKDPLTILSTLAQTRDILDMERFSQSKAINKTLINRPLFIKIFILDHTGVVVATTSFGEEFRDFSERLYFAAAMAGNEFNSEVYFTPSRFPAMDIALPIKKYNEVEGVLVGEIDLKNIWTLMDTIRVGKTGYALLLSSDGTVIAHPEKQRVLNKEKFTDYPFYPQLMDGTEGIAFYQDNQTDAIAAYVPIPDVKWGIVLLQSRAEAFDLARRMRYQVSIFVAITTVLALVLAFRTIRRITQPIDTLVRGVREYANGNLTHRIKIERQDELVVLADEFNKMVESLEKNQRQLQRMERLAATSRFASLVSHEIRNPLNAMNINLQILRRLITEADSPPDKKMKYLNIITSEINRMNSLVSNFLAITRPPELNLIRSDIHQILEEVVITLEAQARSIGVYVQRKYFDQPLLGMFDHNQLKQVFQNILLNAFDAMPEGGEVCIHTSMKLTSKTKKHPSRKLVIAISDSGQGIPKSRMNDIFELYFTTKKTGSGLGLAIARQIVEGHKGNIMIDSTEGSGTTVTIEIPLEG